MKKNKIYNILDFILFTLKKGFETAGFLFIFYCIYLLFRDFKEFLYFFKMFFAS